MENWKATMPVASLMSDSPLSSALQRGEMSASFAAAETAMGSVGPSAAPSAKAAASEMEGMMALTKKPTPTMMAITSPIASATMERRFFQSSAFDASLASWNSSGAMNITRKRSDSSKRMSTDPPANMAMMRPSAIWISGEETFGTSWSTTEDTNTAQIKSRTSTNVSMGRSLE